jgi:selenocysteine lyase/cysteine desulfurase
MVQSHIYLPGIYPFINTDKCIHKGAYGGYPRLVQEAFQSEAEAQPDSFIRYIYPSRLNSIRATLASKLNVATDELVLIPNATTGINTVLRNLAFSPGGKIVYFSSVCGAIERTLRYLTESTPVQAFRVEYSYPISDDELVGKLRATLKLEKGVKAVVFDTRASMPGVRMPFEALAGLCREIGVLSVVDGAHGIGHIELKLESWRPDSFVSNYYK